jgi:hypothetical protein
MTPPRDPHSAAARKIATELELLTAASHDHEARLRAVETMPATLAEHGAELRAIRQSLDGLHAAVLAVSRDRAGDGRPANGNASSPILAAAWDRLGGWLVLAGSVAAIAAASAIAQSCGHPLPQVPHVAPAASARPLP